MENRSIDDLLKKKIAAARWGKRLRVAAIVVVALAVVGFTASSLLNRGDEEPYPVNTPEAVSASPISEDDPDDPSPSPTAEDEGEEEGEPSPSASAEPAVTPSAVGKYKHEIQLVWFGDAEAPSDLSITLAHKKNELFTVNISAADGWHYVWSDDYTAEELSLRGDFPDNITVEYTVSGENFTVTVTCHQPEQLPQTGTDMAAAVAVMLMGAWVLLSAYTIGRKKKA